jgi:lipopolysaccharide export system permease protein
VRVFKILDAYVFREAASLFVLGFSGFLGFMVINKLFLEAERILSPQMPGWVIVKLALLDAPYYATLSLPVATMFATLMCMGRLAKDNELDALFTNGISLYRLFLPFLLLASIAVISSYVISEYLITAATREQQRLKDANPIVLERDEIEDPDPFIARMDNGAFVTASVFDKESGHLTNIIYDDWNFEEGTRLLSARQASVQGDDLVMGYSRSSPALEFGDLLEEDDAVGEETRLYQGYAEQATATVDLGMPLKEQLTQMKTPQELTQTELAEQSKLKRQLGENTAKDDTDYHIKFSGPFASLAFALVAMPLSLRAPRDERLIGLIFCFILGLVYYMLFFVGKLMGYNQVLDPWLAAWIKDIVFAIIAFLIFVSSRK